jgi:hypothetical protein
MEDSKTSRMVNAARDPVVALLKYNKLKSRIGEQLVLTFEGYEDPIFYTTIAERCGFKHNFHPLVVNGKDMVLGLKVLLSKSTEADKSGGVAFFIDADFDNSKGVAQTTDLYITPTYSIENILTTPTVLASILKYEFKLYEPDQLEDLPKIIHLYENVLAEFNSALKDVNLLIYFGRTASERICGSRIVSIDDSSEHFFKLHKDSFTITSYCKEGLSKNVVKFDVDFDFNETCWVKENFEELTPHTGWRGKFYFSLFVQFVQALVEDRNAQQPKFFSKGRGKVKLNLATESVIRTLSTACEIPTCLDLFFKNLPQHALH